jgi:hypothetical protein
MNRDDSVLLDGIVLISMETIQLDNDDGAHDLIMR